MDVFVKKYQLSISYVFLFLSILLLVLGFMFLALVLFDVLMARGNYPSWAIVFIIAHLLVSFGVNRLSAFFIKKLRADIARRMG